MENPQIRRLMGLPFYLCFTFLFGSVGLVLLTSLRARGPYGELLNSWNFASYRNLLDPLYFAILIRTLKLALINTFFCILLAYPLSFKLLKIGLRLRSALLASLFIPLLTSYLVRLLGIQEFFRLRLFGVDVLYSEFAIQMGLITNYLPFAILPIYSTLSKIPHTLIEAAQDLGATRLGLHSKILLPLSKSGVWSAAVFTFIPSLGEYLLPEILGGGQHYYLGSFLQNQFLGARNWPLGAAALCILVLLTLIGLAIGSIFSKQDESAL